MPEDFALSMRRCTKLTLTNHSHIILPVIEHSLGHKLAQELELVPDLGLVGGLGVPRQGQRI